VIDLSGKAALVTGGSRGIGRACCYALARAGAKVCVNYVLERPSAELVAQRIEEAGGHAFALGADVADRSQADMLVDETVDRYGGLTSVTSAGI
jgi:NAD(P)-dependent dehydrogenase (short-subunit alcohol dehydrogenase family)